MRASFFMMFCCAEMRLLRNDVCYRTFYHAPQADIIAHTMRTSFRRKADKGRYCVGVAVADDGVGDVAVGLDGGTLFHGGL